jgi:putative inorganic carbon (hco3(-)) transporter
MNALRQDWIVPACLLAAAGVGTWAAIDPSFLKLDPARDARSLALTLLAVGAAAALMLRPKIGLALFTATVYLNLSQVLVRQYDFPSLLQLLALPLLAAALVERGVRGPRAMPSGLLVLMGAYLVSILLSTNVAMDRTLADARLAEAARGFVVVLVVALLASTRERARITGWVLVGGAAFLSLLGIIQTLTGSYAMDFGGLARIKHAHIYGRVFEPRIAGPVGDPNYFAQMLLIVVPLALFAAWEEGRRHLRLVAWIATAVIVAAITLTYSRGGALALGFVLILALLAHGTDIRKVALGLALLGAGLFVAPTGFQERLATVTELLPGDDDTTLYRDSSFQERLLLGRVAWEMFASHPLRGVGAGNYTTRFDEYAHRVPSAARDYAVDDADRYPHNLFLELGAEGGIVLLGAFAALMAYVLTVLLRARQRFRKVADGPMAALATAVTLGLTGYLASSLFLHGAFQRYLWLLLGLAAALHVLSLDTTASSDVTPCTGPDPLARPGSGGRP